MEFGYNPPPDERGCVVGSHGYLEIVSSGGSAADALGCGIGDEVVVEV